MALSGLANCDKGARCATLVVAVKFFLLTLSLLLSAPAALAQTSARPEPVLDVSSMDTTVDPCVDFYTYACGGWMKNNPIPPDQPSWAVYSKLEDQNRLVLRDILQQAAVPSPDRNAVAQKIGDYYAACMDEKAIDAAGIKPLQSALDQITALQSEQDIATVAASMMDDGALFEFSSDQDFKDSSQVIAEVDQGGLGLPDRDLYRLRDARTKKVRKEYAAHVRRIFELLGDTPNQAENESKSVMRIETALANGSMSRVDHRDPQKVYHKMTRVDLEALSPAFQWDTYFAETGVPAVQSLNVATPGFFKVLSKELKKESLPSWKSYLRWHLVHANALYLSAPFVDATFDFYGKTLLGEQTLEPRWKRCVNYVDDDLGEALGQAYVAQKFPPEAKQRALKMVKQIEAAMQRDIESLSWMSAQTKQQALEKLHAVANKIGYPDKWRDYSALEISRDDEIGNALRARAFEFHRQLAKIGKPVDRGEWSMTPATVNAYYDSQLNDVNFPAGILQPPLFDPSSDDAPNYGDTGATIGHELTHGFDDAGRQFDAKGNMRDWWTPEDARQFEKRASCLVDQYSHYTVVDDIKVNGKLTLGENVADLGGLILAYMAWQEQTKGQRLAPIDGFTPEQRFFIGYGQSWCANVRDEDKRMRAMSDPHSPDKYRANGVVSDMPEFQQAFHCKTDAPMVRKDRCRVW
jgi:putative endopeptidase